MTAPALSLVLGSYSLFMCFVYVTGACIMLRVCSAAATALTQLSTEGGVKTNV